MMEDMKLKSELDALRKLYDLLKDRWFHSQNAVSDYYLDDNTLFFLKSLLDDAAQRVFEGHLKFMTTQFVPPQSVVLNSQLKTEEKPVLVPSISFNNHLKISAKASEIISMKAEEEDKRIHNSELKSHKIVSDGSLQPETTGKKRHCKICQQTNDAKHFNPGMTVDPQQLSKSIHLHQIKGQEEGIEFDTANCIDTNEQKRIHKSAVNDDLKEIHKPIPSEIDDVIKKIELHISVLHSGVGRQINPLEKNSIMKISNFGQKDCTKDVVLQKEPNIASESTSHGKSDRSSFDKRPMHQMSLKKSRRNLDWQQPEDWSQSSEHESIETKSSTDYSSWTRPSTSSDGSDEYLSQNVDTSSSNGYSRQSSDSNSEDSTSSRSVSSTKNYKTSDIMVPKEKQKGRLRRLKDKLAIIFHHHHHHHHHHHGDVVTNNEKETKVHAERIVHAGDNKYGKNVAVKAPDKNWKGHFHALAEGLLRRHIRNSDRLKKQPKTDIKPQVMKGRDGMMVKKLHWWKILIGQRGGGVKLPSKPRVKLGGKGRKRRRPKALPHIK